MRLAGRTGWPAAIALAASLSSVASAQTALSFDAAQMRLDRTSRALSAADHGVEAAKAGADAMRTLRRPIVTASAQYLVYEKTLSVDLTDTKRDALGSTQDFLAAFPGSVPPAFQQIAGEITGRLSQALPGLFDAIPNDLSYRFRDEVFRPTVQAAMPLYTGGAIPAIQRAAQGGVAMAEGRRAQVVDLARILSDTRKLEAAGVIPHARTLEVQVARDTAERSYQRAELSSATARDELARLLDLDAVVPTTALFVETRPLAPVQTFLGNEGTAPEARTADAGRQIADAGVALARSRRLPQAYAFGEYNANRSNALPIEPDWIAGVGVRYTILSNIDRRRTEDAARAQAAAAADTAAEARRIATSATVRAYNLVEGARRSFVLLDSSLAAARENLRVQTVAFREGEGTATPVIAAQAALDAAEAQRIAVAYEYDLALAGLLASAGKLDAYGDHLARADQRLVYGTGQ
jgi:outer membrane protein TolC